MAKKKKRDLEKKSVSKKINNKFDKVLQYYFIGIVLVIIIQAFFMYGGMLLENNKGSLITGLPSAFGLTLVLLIGLFLFRKSEFILLGSFTFAFISPLILLIIVIFKAMPYVELYMKSSIVYMTVMILVVWSYYVNRILKGKM